MKRYKNEPIIRFFEELIPSRVIKLRVSLRRRYSRSAMSPLLCHPSIRRAGAERGSAYLNYRGGARR